MTFSPLLMFPLLFVAVLAGVPVAIAMMGTAFLFGYSAFGEGVGFQFLSKVEEISSNFVLAAVPLFIFMGATLERGGVAEDLFSALRGWTRRLPGGLAIATMMLCVIFAAATGVVGATEAIVGLLAVRPLLAARYDHRLIAGTICAGGSLGTIIPPSVVVVILGPVAGVSVGDLLFGSVIPGLLLAILFIIFIAIAARVNPGLAPNEGSTLSFEWRPLVVTSMRALVPPLVMILLVLGSLMAGIAAPTEAAALGALGAVLIAAVKRRMTVSVLREALLTTVRVTSMIMFVLLAGNMFTGVFVGTGGGVLLDQFVTALQLNGPATVVVLLGTAFFLGFCLDWVSVTLILIPIVMPLVAKFGYDPIWFCVLFMLVIQTSYLTPPMAPAIFYFRGISPPEISFREMVEGVLPFVALELVAIGLVAAYPELVLWLPRQLLGF